MGTWTVTKPTATTQRPVVLGSHRETNELKSGGLRHLIAGEIKSVLAMALSDKARVGEYGASRPVFLVTFTDNTTLVIKAEINPRRQDGQHSALWSGKMMRQVSPNLKVKQLTNDEIFTLKELREVVYSVRPIGTRVKHSVPAIARAFMVDMIDSGQFLFYKMPYYETLFDADVALKGPAQATKLYAILCRPGCLRSLGRVIAADLFNGNNDRFSNDGRLTNSGNVFFHKLENGTHEVIGVDFYEAQGEDSNLKRPVTPNWGGYNLRTPASREAFARKVISALNDFFSQVEGVTAFGDTHAWQVRLGMEEAIEAMKAYINRRIMGKPISQGVLMRARLLGWGL